MEFISKYNLTFVTYVNRKYDKKFRSFEDYSLYIFEINSSELDYYYQLEEDMKEYSKYQFERRIVSGKTKD